VSVGLPSVAILAGGLATRLGDVTRTIPKALVEVAGRPFIAHQLELLRAAGATRVVLCISHFADQIEAELGTSWHGVEILYSRDQLEGTGGALRRALPLLGDAFLVVYGDSYLRCDYAAIANAWLASGKLGLMTVYKNDGRYDASNVEYTDHVVRYSKTDTTGMTHIDWGLGGFRAAAFAGYSDGKLDLARVYQDLLANGELFGYEVHERFYEIGSHAGLADTRRLLGEQS
jgi:N-acetyl-alpha-D-muramate 1-phosphate uridylyltransferase